MKGEKEDSSRESEEVIRRYKNIVRDLGLRLLKPGCPELDRAGVPKEKPKGVKVKYEVVGRKK